MQAVILLLIICCLLFLSLCVEFLCVGPCFVVWFLVSILFSNHLAEEEGAGFFTLCCGC